MNRRTGKTSENKSLKQAETRPSGKNMSLEEAKQEVLAMVDRGDNYRSIAKIPFKVDGVVRRFSISQISTWKKEREKGVSEEGEASMSSKVFKLFEEGKGPVQCVIELNIKPEDANEYYKCYLEMKEQDLSAPSVPRRLKELEDLVEYLQTTQGMSIINPYAGCGNPNCSAKYRNELEVEAVCSVCGRREMTPVNWQDKDEEEEE